MPPTHLLADRCQRRDSGIKCLRGASSKGGRTGEATKKRPPLMTPLEWPESAIPRPWAMANGDGHPFTRSFSAPDGRRTCQSPTWQPADYTSHTIAIGIARGHGDTLVVTSRAKERKKRMSNLERERVRDNANKSGLCSTSLPPSQRVLILGTQQGRRQAREKF